MASREEHPLRRVEDEGASCEIDSRSGRLFAVVPARSALKTKAKSFRVSSSRGRVHDTIHTLRDTMRPIKIKYAQTEMSSGGARAARVASRRVPRARVSISKRFHTDTCSASNACNEMLIDTEIVVRS